MYVYILYRYIYMCVWYIHIWIITHIWNQLLGCGYGHPMHVGYSSSMQLPSKVTRKHHQAAATWSLGTRQGFARAMLTVCLPVHGRYVDSVHVCLVCMNACVFKFVYTYLFIRFFVYVRMHVHLLNNHIKKLHRQETTLLGKKYVTTLWNPRHLVDRWYGASQ